MPDHPVVHLSWEDANSYCEWKGTRLPAEAEFEYAARGGLEGARYAWVDELTPGGEHRANLWQGTFPQQDRVLDGFGSHGPVKQFSANGYGLYDMTGNVWEWVNDWYDPDTAGASRRPIPRGQALGTKRCRAGADASAARTLIGLPSRSAHDDGPGLRHHPPLRPLRSGRSEGTRLAAGPHHRHGTASPRARIASLRCAHCGPPVAGTRQ